MVEARYRLSAEEQKIIKILISQIQKDDEDFKRYEFRIKDLASFLGINHHEQYSVLKRVTERLITRPLSFENPETREFLQTAWLSSASYREGEGTVAFCFDPNLKPLLLHLKSFFTRYELEQILQFTGQYTIRFFEFRKAYLGQNKKELTLDLTNLRAKLGLKKDEYKEFFDFKRRVLEPARKELKEKTGKSFTWKAVRQGRGGKIVAIQLVFDDEEDLENGNNNKTLDVPREKFVRGKNVIENNLAVQVLLSCGIVQQVAVELSNTYSEEYIKEKIAIAELYVNTGGVKNKAGFVVQAIKEDWRDGEIEKRKTVEERRRVEEEQKEKERRLRKFVEGYAAYRKQYALGLYDKLSAEQKAEWKKEFLSKLPTALLARFRKKKEFDFEDGMYRSFVMGKMELPALEEYLAMQDITLSEEEHKEIEQLLQQ